MAYRSRALFSLACLCGAPEAAAAAATTSTTTSNRTWDYHVSIVSTLYVIGFAPAKIVSADAKQTYIARNEPSARDEVRGRLHLYGRYLHLEAEPYSVIPHGDFTVTLAGVEVGLYAPVFSWLRAGVYHHSAHNFSDGRLGQGIDLDGLAGEATLWQDGFFLDNLAGTYRIRLQGRYFTRQEASPHLFTTTTATLTRGLSHTAWRGSVSLDARHPYGNLQCGVVMVSDGTALASVQADCTAGLRVGIAPLGAFGDHFLVGPYLFYGRNLSRMSEFGLDTAIVGVRLDLQYAD